MDTERFLLIQTLYTVYQWLALAGAIIGIGIAIVLLVRKHKTAGLLALFGFLSLGVYPLLLRLPTFIFLYRTGLINNPGVENAWMNFRDIGYPIVGSACNFFGLLLVGVALLIGLQSKRKLEQG
ncbi:MAG: hypothetical protein FD146_1867 [Anaerolineaceae bacterium]|nr:MAG: hypothetical protein FD146_1867 [Anaerolineaceae bacterium]